MSAGFAAEGEAPVGLGRTSLGGLMPGLGQPMGTAGGPGQAGQSGSGGNCGRAIDGSAGGDRNQSGK